LKEQAMPRKRILLDVSVGLSAVDVQKLDDIAELTGSRRTEVIRLAIRQFVNDYGKRPDKEYESILEARLRKMENRLADLIVLAVRAAAQALYYMTLPYSRGGFPTRPLKEEVFQGQWQKSRAFASQFLKHAVIDLTPPAANMESQAE
jgi:hypothetical protein